MSDRDVCECIPDISSHARGDSPNMSDTSFKLYASRLITYENDNVEITHWNIWTEVLVNPIIAIVLLTCYLLLVPLWFWAKRMDKLDDEKKFYIEVCDNSPFSAYRFLVTIFTGYRSGAGSSAAVSLGLKGKKKGTVAHVIQNEGEDHLTRGSVRTFLITTPDTLGDITDVIVWRNNGGESPEWYLSRMTVQDIENNEAWFFICNCWLSTTYHCFGGARASQLQQFRSQFWYKCENYFRDAHLWLSLFAMQPVRHRSMTRIRRLACSYVQVFFVMLTNLTWFGIAAKFPGFEVKVGDFQISWCHIVVGIQSAFISVLQTEIITSLFRLYPKPRTLIKQRLKTKEKSTIKAPTTKIPKTNDLHQEPEITDNHESVAKPIKPDTKVVKRSNKKRVHTKKKSSRSQQRRRSSASGAKGSLQRNKQQKRTRHKKINKGKKRPIAAQQRKKSPRKRRRSTNSRQISRKTSTKTWTSRVSQHRLSSSTVGKKGSSKHVSRPSTDVTRKRKESSKRSKTSHRSAQSRDQQKKHKSSSNRSVQSRDHQKRERRKRHPSHQQSKQMSQTKSKKPDSQHRRKSSSGFSGKRSEKSHSLRTSTQKSSSARTKSTGKRTHKVPSNKISEQRRRSSARRSSKSSQKSKHHRKHSGKPHSSRPSPKSSTQSRVHRETRRKKVPQPRHGLQLRATEPDANEPGMEELRPGVEAMLPTQIVLYITWFLVFLSVIVSTVVCLLYGMEYGQDISKEWLSAFVFAIFMVILVVEPLKVFAMAFFRILGRAQIDVKDWVLPLPGPVTKRRHKNPKSEEQRLKKKRRENPLYRPPVHDV